MIDSSQSTIQEVSVHIVGNGGNQEGIQFSKSPMVLKDEKIHRLLVEYFLF